jgi:hypothetical protein
MSVEFYYIFRVMFLTWGLYKCTFLRNHLCLYFNFVSRRLEGGPVGVSLGTNW